MYEGGLVRARASSLRAPGATRPLSPDDARATGWAMRNATARIALSLRTRRRETAPPRIIPPDVAKPPARARQRTAPRTISPARHATLLTCKLTDPAGVAVETAPPRMRRVNSGRQAMPNNISANCAHACDASAFLTRCESAQQVGDCERQQLAIRRARFLARNARVRRAVATCAAHCARIPVTTVNVERRGPT